MRIPRIYLPQPLAVDQEALLDERALRHVVQVLRLKAGQALVLFNGEGGEYAAELIEVGKRQARVRLTAFRDISRESPLPTHLGLGIAKAERMDFALQKAVELGVSRITPLRTERGVVRLDGNRLQRKLAHWQGVLISACEQCGRNTVPELAAPLSCMEWLEQPQTGTRLILDPRAGHGLGGLARPEALSITIGPEGGFSPKEREQAYAAGFTGIALGPRILRAETAALTALAMVQAMWGDLGLAEGTNLGEA
jgi:16S rRNA (uracil1498-N3)-methyltransferase